VVRDNEYRVPSQLPDDALVIDIGTHIGAFSYLALSRGARNVIGYEPDLANYRCAEQNLASFGTRARMHRAAVWRSDIDAGRLPFLPSTDAANTGGGTIIWESEGASVETVSFNTVLASATSSGRRVHVVKMDCEGAEFPILLTSPLLDRVDNIVGEYHELRGALPAHARIDGVTEFTRDHLTRALRDEGFSVSCECRAMAPFGELGLFFAHRDAGAWTA
jgi:FkbM family methyltransferase